MATTLAAAPSEFARRISSGVKSSELNSDLTYRVELTGTPASALRVDSFLISDAVIFLAGNGRYLQVKW